jgi:hypothetical protein
MKTKLPTVDELNAVQDEWMKLDSNGPEKEKNRVLALYAAVIPKSYLGVSEDKMLAGLMIDGAPIYANKRPIEEVIKHAQSFPHRVIRTDVAWCGSIGRFVSIP